jgi:hypothetical protein
VGVAELTGAFVEGLEVSVFGGEAGLEVREFVLKTG